MKKILLFFAAVVAFASCKENTELEIQKPDSVKIAPESKVVRAKGGTVEVIVTSSGEWILDGGKTWAKPSVTEGKDGDIVKFTIEPNGKEKDRSAVWIFSHGEASAEFTLSQKNVTIEDEIRISSPGSVLPSGGGKVEVTVESSSDWTLEGEYEWIKLSAREGKSGDKVRFDISPNITDKKLVADFVFSAGEATAGFKVEVEVGNIPVLELIDKTLEEPFNCGHAEVALRTNVDYRALEAIIPENIDWLTFNFTSEQNEDGIAYMNFVLTDNTTGNARSATITINGGGLTAEVEIIQYFEPVICIEQEEFMLNASACEIEVPVRHNVEYILEMPEEARAWITHKGTSSDIETFNISAFGVAAGMQRQAVIRFVEKTPVPGASKPVSDSITVTQRTGALVTGAIDFTKARTAPVWGDNFMPVSNLREFTVEFLMSIHEIKSGFNRSNIFGMDKNFIIRMGDIIRPNDRMQILYSENMDGQLSKFNLDNVSFKAKQWYHIAVTLKEGRLTLYVDGEKKGEQQTQLPAVNFGMPYVADGSCFRMGFVDVASTDFNGLLTEFRIWNKALSAADLQAENHFYTVVPGTDGLVAYWKMNDASGVTVKDYSGNGYDMIGHINVESNYKFDEGVNWVEVALPFEE